MQTDSPQSGAARRGIRWWPLWLFAAVGGAGVVVARSLLSGNRQWANYWTAAIGLATLALAAFWLLFLSRMRLRSRVALAAVGPLALLLVWAGFSLRGFTGDMLPILVWRWSEAPPPVLEAAPAEHPGTLPELDPLPGLADYPQFFGPARTGVLAGPALARDWQAQPPAELWRVRVGEAWSGFATRGRRAITQEQHGEEEVVVCYDLATGEVLWAHRDRARYANRVAGRGPRATPTIDGDRVFTQGATGILSCLGLRDGARAWSVNILDDNHAPLPEWGVAGSPLVADGCVIVNAGGRTRSLVAYDAETGARLWSGGSAPAHWSSPIRATIAGVDQTLIFNSRLLAYRHPGGELLWSHVVEGPHPHICLPVVLPGDRVFVSAGYGTGCDLVQVEKGADGALSARSSWHSLALKAKFTNVVAHEGHVYGLDDGIMACVDLDSGRRRWKKGRYGHGQLILVGGLLLVTSEDGEVILMEPSPEEARELTRFRAFDGKMWNPPALAGRYLLVRTEQEAACYRLPLAGE